MDPIRASAPAAEPVEKSARPWGQAILSGAVFGGLAAAAASWIGYHSQPPGNRMRVHFARNWSAGIAGVASGAVAMYGTLRSAEEPPEGVHNEAPARTVQATSVVPIGKLAIHPAAEHSL